MPSRKDDPDARLTIGYSIYRLPRSGLVQRPFAIHRQERLQARAAVCRIPCRILCLADVERVCPVPCAERALRSARTNGLDDRSLLSSARPPP